MKNENIDAGHKDNWYAHNALWVSAFVYLILLSAMLANYTYSKGYQRADKNHKADYATHYKAQRDSQNCEAKPTAKEAVECYKDAEKTYRENTRAEQDLDAQVEMADWAEGMLWATSVLGTISILVTGIGLFFVWRTLETNRDATNAAVEANRIAQELFAAENRPWIRFAKPVEVGNYWDSNSGSHISVTASLQNTGKTTAVDVRASLILDVPNVFSFLSNKPVAEFAEREASRPELHDFGKIAVFANSDQFPEISASSNDVPDTDKAIRAIICVTYRASGFENIYYTAIAVEFDAAAIVDAEGDVAIPEHGAYFTKIQSEVVPGSLAMS